MSVNLLEFMVGMNFKNLKNEIYSLKRLNFFQYKLNPSQNLREHL